MSLINDVLKDLERRQAPDRVALPLPQSASGRPRRFHLAWWLLAAVCFGIALHWLVNTSDSVTPVDLPALADASSDETAAVLAVPLLAAMDPAPATDGATGAELGSEPVLEPDAASTRSPTAEDGADSRPDTVPVTAAAARPQPEPAGRPGTGTPAAKADAPDGSEQNIRIERADRRPDGDDREPIESARRAIAHGRYRQGQQQLRELLRAQPELDEARLLLAASLLQHQGAEPARRVLEEGLREGGDATLMARRLGRIHLEHGQVRQARDVLAAHAPAPADDPDYHQLLAAVHRQAGDHVQAEAAYRTLSQLMPQRGAVWIGLGASLEALDRPAEARDAYGRALGADDARAAGFARQRLQVLPQADGER